MLTLIHSVQEDLAGTESFREGLQLIDGLFAAALARSDHGTSCPDLLRSVEVSFALDDPIMFRKNLIAVETSRER